LVAVFFAALVIFSLTNHVPNMTVRANSEDLLPPGSPPPSDPSNTHWWAGSVYPNSTTVYQVSSIRATIPVPNSSPESDGYYYVYLSIFDNNESYNQIGFANVGGTWRFSYSWTTNDGHGNLHYNTILLGPASQGVAYTFNITAHSGIVTFAAYQGVTQIWTYEAQTGGTLLIVSQAITFPGWQGGKLDYTCYEEVWEIHPSGAAPDFLFRFYDQYWVLNGIMDSSNAWIPFIVAEPPYTFPSSVAVAINGNSVVVDNHPPNDPTLSGTSTVVANVQYTYTTNPDTDPDFGDHIRYHLNVADPYGYLIYQNTTVFVGSGTPMSWNLIWGPVGLGSIFGSYSLVAQVEDSAGQLSNITRLLVSLVGATITAVNLYYNNPSQNLTTLNTNVIDYYANVNFTWSGGRAYNVSLWVDVLNPPGCPVTEAWVDPMLGPSVQYSYLDPGNYAASSIDITQYIPHIGIGTLRVILKYQGLNCGERDEAVNIANSNRPPNTPSFIWYTQAGYVNVSYRYTVNATDPDNDSIQYVFNWGDGTANTTLAWCGSGVQGTAYHSWASEGGYYVTVYVYDPYGAWNSSTLLVIITSSSESCPFVSAWNGTGYVQDNNILPQSETSNGTDVTDYYTLEQSLVPKDGEYAILLSEFEREHSFIDYAQLLAVDHPANVNVGVSPYGQVLTYTHPHPAVSAITNEGKNVKQLLSQVDGNYYQGYNGSYITLNFGDLDVSHGAKLVIVSDMIIIKCPIYIQTMDANGAWWTVATIYTRNHWATDVIDLKNYLPDAQDSLKVRLAFVHNDTVDFVGLDTSPQATIDIHPGQLVSAFSSADGDVTANLLYADKSYAELVPSENIQLAFNLPDEIMQARTYIFIADGHYYTITP